MHPRPLALASALLLSACGDPSGGVTTGQLGTTEQPGTTADSSASSTTTGTTGQPDPTTGATAQATTTGATTSGDPGTSGDTTAAQTTNAQTTGDAASTGAPACPGGGLAAGTHTVMLEWDGLTRQAIVHVPPGYDAGTPTPLVLNLHGLTSNATQQLGFSGMNQTADAEGFVVAYPSGVGDSWNAGACCGTAVQQKVDDVGFLRALVEHLHTQLCIDPARVYATGMSNGGFMTNRLACEAADLFAAVAPVSSTLITPDCAPTRPVPIIVFNGTGDLLVPYGGGLYQGAQATFQDWATIDGCTGDPVPGKIAGTASCETYDQCQGGVSVTLCTIDGMGHCWPGQPLCPWGAVNTDMSANDEMWALFSQHTLP